MVRINHLKLIKKLSAWLVCQSVSVDLADKTARILVEGDLAGHPGHGAERITQIRSGFANQTIQTNGRHTVKKCSQTVTLIDAHYNLGYPVVEKAVHTAVDLAKQFGVGVCAVKNASHIGILGYYANLASQHGCICVILSSTSPAVVLPGGKEQLLGTNPISYAIPMASGPSYVADFSTSSVSRTALIEHMQSELCFDSAVGVDANGIPSQDPQQIAQGGLLPFGDLKGAHLSILFSILCGPLIGTVTNDFVKGTRSMEQSPNKGDFVLCFDVSSCTDISTFTRSVQSFSERMAAYSDRFRVPGAHTSETRKKNMRDGVVLSDKLCRFFEEEGISL